MTRFIMSSTAALALALSAGMAAAQNDTGQDGGQNAGGQEGAATTFDFFASPEETEIGWTDFNRTMDDTGVYDAWDEDADETLTRDEFNRGMFSRYDANRDDILDQDELDAARRAPFFAEESEAR